MKTIDAIGLACPQPVMKTKEAVDNGFAEFSILVDNKVAASNVARFLKMQSFSFSSKDSSGIIQIDAKKSSDQVTLFKKTERKEPSLDIAILLSSDKIGADSNGLGDLLMKSYLGTLIEANNSPKTVALMNEAVKMTLKESSALDSLKKLANKGTSILVCGACTKHFGITDQVEVGVISNMFEITEAVFDASKPIVIGGNK